jgi:hypothetical protein
MANCSIPNSKPAIGRISMRSSRRSRKRNSAPTSFFAAPGLANASSCGTSRFFNVQRSTLNAQRSIQTVGRSMLDVERCAFSVFRRVKGAWWPSRSSKPSSPRKWRGRFDSYPLRFFIFDFRLPIFDCSVATALRRYENFMKGGEPHVA